MMDLKEVRKKLRNLPATKKFIVRIVYPIVLFIPFYLIYKYTAITNIRLVQIIFIAVWGGVEYVLFLKKNNE